MSEKPEIFSHRYVGLCDVFEKCRTGVMLLLKAMQRCKRVNILGSNPARRSIKFTFSETKNMIFKYFLKSSLVSVKVICFAVGRPGFDSHIESG